MDVVIKAEDDWLDSNTALIVIFSSLVSGDVAVMIDFLYYVYLVFY